MAAQNPLQRNEKKVRISWGVARPSRPSRHVLFALVDGGLVDGAEAGQVGVALQGLGALAALLARRDVIRLAACITDPVVRKNRPQKNENKIE
jgi:hypothetical protein